MKTTLVSLVTVALAASVHAQLAINTPNNVVQCEPILLQWSGGTAPYFVSITPGADPSGAALLNFGQTSSTSLTWTANFTQGTSLDLNLRDSTGATAQSAPFPIQPGSDSSCLSGGSSSSTTGASSGTSTGSTTSGATTSAASTGTSTAIVTGTTALTSGTSSVTSHATTTTSAGTSSKASTTAASSAAASSTTSNSATSAARIGQVGAAGIVGAIIAAIIA